MKYEQLSHPIDRKFNAELNILTAALGQTHLHSAPSLDQARLETLEREAHVLRANAIHKAGTGLIRVAQKLTKHAVTAVKVGLNAWREWRNRRRAKAELASLSDQALKDIGLTRGDIFALSHGAVSADEINRLRTELISPLKQNDQCEIVSLPITKHNDAPGQNQRLSVTQRAA